MAKGSIIRRRVTVISRRRRLLDKDNLHVKGAVDALKGIFIEDDSPAHIELHVRQEKVGSVSQEATIIEIEEIE